MTAILSLFFVTNVRILFALHSVQNIYVITLNCMLIIFTAFSLFFYKLFNVNHSYYKLIPILIGSLAVCKITLSILGKNILANISIAIFFVLLSLPLLTKKDKNIKECDIKNFSVKTAVIFFVFLILHIPVALFHCKLPFLVTFFRTVFFITCQIPGLLYYFRRLSQKKNPTEINKPAVSSGALNPSFTIKDLPSLTKRENEIARALYQGLKYEEIAEKFFISLSAVKKHTYNIYRKLNINNNRELMHIIINAKNDATHN